MISFGRHVLWKCLYLNILVKLRETKTLHFSEKYAILQCYLIMFVNASFQHLIMLWRTSINDNYQFRNTESDCTCFGTESCLRHVRWRHLHALSEATNKTEARVAPVSRRMPSPAKKRKRWGYCEERKMLLDDFFFFLGEKVKNRSRNILILHSLRNVYIVRKVSRKIQSMAFSFSFLQRFLKGKHDKITQFKWTRAKISQCSAVWYFCRN